MICRNTFVLRKLFDLQFIADFDAGELEYLRDARLVGNDDHPEARPVQTSNRLEAPRNGLPLVDRLDVVVGVLVDDAVAVEQNELQWSRYSA